MICIYILFIRIKNKKNKNKKGGIWEVNDSKLPREIFMKKVENNIMEQSTIVIWKENNNSIMYETWKFDHENQKWIGYHSIPSWREEDIFLRYVLDDTDQLFNHLIEMIGCNIQIIYKDNMIAGNEWIHTMKNLNPEAFHDDYNVLTNSFINIIENLLETNEDTYDENKLKWIEYPTPFVKKVLEERISFDEKGIGMLEIEGIAHIINSDLDERSLLKRIINASFKDSGLLPRTFLEWRIYNALSVKEKEEFPFQLPDIRDESFREEIEIAVEEFSDSLRFIVASLINFDKRLIEEEYNKSIYIESYPILDTKENMAGMTRFERKMMEDIVEIEIDISIWLDEVTKLMGEYPPLHWEYRMDPSPSIDTVIFTFAESKNPEFHRGQSGFGLNNEYPDRILRHRGEGCDKWIPVD